MAAGGPPELLIELLSSAARTPAGEVGLLSAAQVADVLGRRPEWVYAHAGLLGGFRLPGSDEWRFCPCAVAAGLLGPDDGGGREAGAGAPARAPATRRLAYPPAPGPRRPPPPQDLDTTGSAACPAPPAAALTSTPTGTAGAASICA